MDTKHIKVTPEWKKSKEQVWVERFAGLVDEAPRVKPLHRRLRVRYAVAAVVAALVFLPTIAYLYTTEVVVERGKQLAVALPDGSQVNLNADSRLTYRPLWWKVSREVTLNGEGFFRVMKGSRFTVNTTHGSVAVLGTSFNVFSRKERFDVTCLTGKVQVTSGEQSAVITSSMQARLVGREIQTSDVENTKQAIGWTEGWFYFDHTPLHEVIAEVERQYNIHITASSLPDVYYTGSFSRDKTLDVVLEIIGKPFGITLTAN